jgi:hypothetical protein
VHVDEMKRCGRRGVDALVLHHPQAPASGRSKTQRRITRLFELLISTGWETIRLCNCFRTRRR